VGTARTTKNTSFVVKYCCYLATSCTAVHTGHSSYCCVFARTCILSRCLAMGICATICFSFLYFYSKRISLIYEYLGSYTQVSFEMSTETYLGILVKCTLFYSILTKIGTPEKILLNASSVKSNEKPSNISRVICG
jgi:hypothetical protein